MDLLVEQAAQAGRVQAEPGRLRPHVRSEVEGGIGVEVGMAIEAGHARALGCDLAVFRLIEFLLRERCEKQAQAFHLHRRDHAIHDLVEISDRQQPTARNVTELRMGSEENRRRKFWGKVIGEIEVDIEPPEIATLLPTNLVDLALWEYLAARCLLDMR